MYILPLLHLVLPYILFYCRYIGIVLFDLFVGTLQESVSDEREDHFQDTVLQILAQVRTYTCTHVYTSIEIMNKGVGMTISIA